MSPSSSSSRLPAIALLMVGGAALAGGLWWVTDGFGSAKQGTEIQEGGPETGAGDQGAGAQTRTAAKVGGEGSAQTGTGATGGTGKGATNKPVAGENNPALAALENRLVGTISDANSTTPAKLRAMEDLLRNQRLAHAGEHEMDRVLPESVHDEELALGLLALAKKYPKESFGSALIRVFDDARTSDIKVAAIRAIGPLQKHGFSNAELERMKRDTSDSVVNDEIDRLLRRRQR